MDEEKDMNIDARHITLTENGHVNRMFQYAAALCFHTPSEVISTIFAVGKIGLSLAPYGKIMPTDASGW